MLARARWSAALSLAAWAGAMAAGTTAARADGPAQPKNLLANPGFEMGREFWQLSLAEGTVGTFAVNQALAAEGQHSALIAVEKVAGWGVQFGQPVEAGQKGKTFTFAVLGRSLRGSVKVSLEVERRGKPYDRAGRSEPCTLAPDAWTEMHATFKVEKDFPEGWTAFVSCTQPDCQFRVDLFRLYEGAYVPWKEQARQGTASVAVRLFDTGSAAAQPLSPDDLAKRAGWAEIPEDKTAHAFGGDAVMLNNRLAVVFRKKADAAEVYSLDGGAKLRSRLSGTGGTPLSLTSLKIVENGPGAVALDTAYQPAGGEPLVLNWQLRMGQVFVQAEPRAGAGRPAALRIGMPCRFVVLPDFFADDIVLDATQTPGARAELPGENFLLHLADDGEAMVSAVWTGRAGDVACALAGEGEKRAVVASEVPFCPEGGKAGKVWVGVLAAPRIWHCRNVAKSDANQIIALDWKPPFTAQWRVDWQRQDKLTDSWEMVAQRPDGQFTKFGWFGSPGTIPADRKRWQTVYGNFLYPCWLDRAGKGFLQPLKKGGWEGPAVIYPILRAPATPLDAFTVADLVRATLGVGPCEYILDVEGQKSEYQGRATCANRDTLNPIFEKGQQKEKRAEIEKSLTEVVVFIRHIRGRIERYVAFGHDALAYLAEQKKARPELAGPLGELETLAKAIDARVAARRAKIKTPDEAAAMVETFRKNYPEYDGATAFQKCKEFTAAIVEIGGNQDELAGECRLAAKIVRQRAGMLLATEPRMVEVAKEIRKRAQDVLRGPAGHEGARH